MFLKKTFAIVILSLFVFSLLSSFSLAQENSGSGLVPCGNDGQPMCTFTHLLELVDNVVQFALFKIAVPIGVIWIIVGGFFMMTAGGNTGRFAKGKTIIYGVVIALLISFGAWLIIDTVLRLLQINKS